MDGGDPNSQRHLLQRTDEFFGQRSKTFALTFGLLFVAVVAVADYLTGVRITVALFYLMPIGLVTWHLGRRYGASMVVVATAAGFLADKLAEDHSDLIPVWNAGVRFAVYTILMGLLATLKSAIERQRSVAEQEHQASEKLRDLNEMKNTLLHAVSHDLKSPLSAIIGSVSTLKRAEQLQLTEEQRESLLEAMDMSGRKMNRLLNDLLDLDRIDHGLLQPVREPTDVGALANRVARECEPLAAHPVRVDADRILVDVDPTMIERIVENLLVNAARHTPVATPVRISVKARSDGIELSVEDEGPGVADDLKVILFESFRQGPESRHGGVGIGLSLVQRFAELHGGKAAIEDRPGGGARFVIWLPGRVASREESDRLSLKVV